MSGNYCAENLTLKCTVCFLQGTLQSVMKTALRKKRVRLVCGRPSGEAGTICVKCCSMKVEKNIWFLELISSELRTEYWISTPSMCSPYIKPGTSQIQVKITLEWFRLVLGRKQLNALLFMYAYSITIICMKVHENIWTSNNKGA